MSQTSGGGTTVRQGFVFGLCVLDPLLAVAVGVITNIATGKKLPTARQRVES